MYAAERLESATTKAPSGAPLGSTGSRPMPSTGFNIGGGTQAPLQPDFPTPPVNYETNQVQGFERMGWDALKYYWSVYPYDIQQLFGSMYGWTNVAMRILKQSFARLDRRVYLENTTENQITQDLVSLNHWAARLERKPYPGAMTKQIWRELAMLWLMTFGNLLIYTPIWMTPDKKKKAFADAEEKLYYRHKDEKGVYDKARYDMDFRRASDAKTTQKEDLDGMPCSLNILETNLVWMIIDPLQLVNKYTYMTRSGIRYFEPYEIIHIKTLYPNDDPIRHILWGSGLVQHAWQSIASSMSLQGYMKNTFDKMFLPPLIVKKLKGGEWNNTEKEAFELRWEAKQQSGKGGMAFIGEYMEVTPIDVTTNFAKFPEANKAMAQEIFAQFGLNFGVVFGEHQNKSTADANMELFYNTPLQSLTNILDEGQTEHYQKYEEGVKLESVPPTTKNADAELKRIVGLFTNGILSLPQAIEESGYDSEGVQDLRVLPTNVQSIENATAPKDTATPAAPPPMKAIKGAVDDGQGYNAADANYAIWKSLDTIRSKHASKLERAVSSAFKSLYKKIDAKLSKAVKGEPTANFIDAPFDKEAFADELSRSLIDGDIAGLIAETIKDQASDLDAPAETDWEKTRVAATEQSIDNIRASADTAFGEIKDLLRANKDKTVDEIKSALKQKFSTLEDSRAHNIAQTTSTSTMGFTSKSVHKELGYKSAWMDLHISAEPRTTHVQMNGKVCDNEGYFTVPNMEGGTNRMLHPGDPNAPASQVCECKCQIKGVRA